MTNEQQGGGAPPPPGGAGGDAGAAGNQAGDPFQPPLRPRPGMTLSELSALAFENARRTERARLALLRRGGEAARDTAYMSLLRAATDDTASFRHLWTAVRDSRELHPDGDPRRTETMAPPHPPSALDERNERAHRIAYEVLEGQRQLPAPGELLACLAEEQPEDGPPPSDGLHPHGRRDLAEASIQALEPQTERAVAGWPVYAIPWKHALREEAAMRLLGKARAVLRSGSDPSGPVASLAATVVLERDSRESDWTEPTWTAIRAFASDSALPPLLAAVLSAALDMDPPLVRLADLVLAASRGRVPSTPEAIADLVDRAVRAVGCLSAKTIDPDPIRNATRKVLSAALSDHADGLLMASVLRELHTLAAWSKEPRTPRYLMARCSLRPVVAHSPSPARRDRAALGIGLLSFIEARARGSDEREVQHGSRLSDAEVTCSSVLADVLRDAALTGAVRVVLHEVMEGRGGEGPQFAERVLRLIEEPTQPSQGAATAEPPDTAPAAARVGSPIAGRRVRLLPFKESLCTATGAPRDGGYVEAVLIRADGRAETLKLARKRYDAVAALAKDGVVALPENEASRKLLDRLVREQLDPWGIRTTRERANRLRLSEPFDLNPAEGEADRAATLRRFAREAERQEFLGQS